MTKFNINVSENKTCAFCNFDAHEKKQVMGNIYRLRLVLTERIVYR